MLSVLRVPTEGLEKHGDGFRRVRPRSGLPSQKKEVQSWFSDPRPKVRTFAEKYSRALERSIAAEQRRSEGDYEMRRREWTEDQ